MAVTEKNQWLHVLLIVFVILAIAGGVGTYLGVTQAMASAEKETAKSQELEKAREYAKVAEQVTNAILAYAGASDTSLTIEEADNDVARVALITDEVMIKQFVDPLMKAKQNYDDDMKDAPKGVETWRALAAFLVTTVNIKNDQILERDDQVRRVKADAASKIAEAIAEKQTALKEKEAAEATLEQEKQQFAKTVSDLNRQYSVLKSSTNDNLKIVQQQLQQVQENSKQLRSMIGIRENTIGMQSDIIENYRRTDFEIADGRITSVNGSSKVAWLNLGYLDALPNQIKFSVYDSQAAEFNESAKKGEIKIQRIVGPHTSEAIITSNDRSNPILPDDFVFTSTWTPGQRTKYFLAGSFDMDGDGKSDQERVKALLIRSGGEIVGELKQDGSKVGQVDPYVRFLVYGGKPADATLSAEVDKIRKKAADEGVNSISYELLLTNLGLGSEAKIFSGGVEKNNGFQPRRPAVIRN